MLLYCGFLFAFRLVLLDVEQERGISILKPELVQILVMGLLILLYHFCFAGLYFFSMGRPWQKLAAVIIAMIIAGSLLYGFNEWYQAVKNPFFTI